MQGAGVVGNNDIAGADQRHQFEERRARGEVRRAGLRARCTLRRVTDSTNGHNAMSVGHERLDGGLPRNYRPAAEGIVAQHIATAAGGDENERAAAGRDSRGWQGVCTQNGEWRVRRVGLRPGRRVRIDAEISVCINVASNVASSVDIVLQEACVLGAVPSTGTRATLVGKAADVGGARRSRQQRISRVGVCDQSEIPSAADLTPCPDHRAGGGHATSAEERGFVHFDNTVHALQGAHERRDSLSGHPRELGARPTRPDRGNECGGHHRVAQCRELDEEDALNHVVGGKEEAR